MNKVCSANTLSSVEAPAPYCSDNNQGMDQTDMTPWLDCPLGNSIDPSPMLMTEDADDHLALLNSMLNDEMQLRGSTSVWSEELINELICEGDGPGPLFEFMNEFTPDCMDDVRAEVLGCEESGSQSGLDGSDSSSDSTAPTTPEQATEVETDASPALLALGDGVHAPTQAELGQYSNQAWFDSHTPTSRARSVIIATDEYFHANPLHAAAFTVFDSDYEGDIVAWRQEWAYCQWCGVAHNPTKACFDNVDQQSSQHSSDRSASSSSSSAASSSAASSSSSSAASSSATSLDLSMDDEDPCDSDDGEDDDDFMDDLDELCGNLPWPHECQWCGETHNPCAACFEKLWPLGY